MASPFQATTSTERATLMADRGFRWVALSCAWGTAIILLWIAVQVFWSAFPAVQKFGLSFLTSTEWNPVTEMYGAAPQIYGTLVTAFLALLIATPLGVGVAIFLSETYLPQKVESTLKFLVELLAAIPSVIYGLWGIFVVIPITRELGNWLYANFKHIPLFSTPSSGVGIFPASVVLAIMVLPTIAALSRVALVNVPTAMKAGAYALGATRWEVIFKVTLPTAKVGIIGSVILALGRAMGETMALAMLVGNNPVINPSLFSAGTTIAAMLANNFGDASGLQMASLMYLAFVLMALTLVVNIIAEVVLGKSQHGSVAR